MPPADLLEPHQQQHRGLCPRRRRPQLPPPVAGQRQQMGPLRLHLLPPRPRQPEPARAPPPLRRRMHKSVRQRCLPRDRGALVPPVRRVPDDELPPWTAVHRMVRYHHYDFPDFYDPPNPYNEHDIYNHHYRSRRSCARPHRCDRLRVPDERGLDIGREGGHPLGGTPTEYGDRRLSRSVRAVGRSLSGEGRHTGLGGGDVDRSTQDGPEPDHGTVLPRSPASTSRSPTSWSCGPTTSTEHP